MFDPYEDFRPFAAPLLYGGGKFMCSYEYPICAEYEDLQVKMPEGKCRRISISFKITNIQI